MGVAYFFIGLFIVIVSLFMILLILVQRGRGGGITGALGGAGGQSAFGSKAGDVFTRITIVTAAIWLFLCLLLILTKNPAPAKQTQNDPGSIGNVEDLDVIPPPAGATGLDGEAVIDESASGSEENPPEGDPNVLLLESKEEESGNAGSSSDDTSGNDAGTGSEAGKTGGSESVDPPAAIEPPATGQNEAGGDASGQKTGEQGNGG